MVLEYLIYPITNGRLRRTDSANQDFTIGRICIPEKTYFFGRGSYIHIHQPHVRQPL